ncbi:uncharacterized protein LOC129187339 [Dunckerocampus dactyliophorus]|uniref:uncharacterized protein LOC129187339 n=1 Tax=Dunckerocampus dactyliophorus TaxID=161453 RepID=UPI0024058DF8|nr:uncharacterized protein LOC129187339 [Dunckerocampus dactyliophorus]
MIPGSRLPSNPASPVAAHGPAHQPQLPTSWATWAQYDLAQAEAELHRLQERHATETDSVKRGVERAILGARREERRLLERVEQDHRDTQQHLEQVQRENVAAARVSQSLLDQRLRKLVILQQRIQEASPNQNLLLKEVAEFLQPWEVSVSLKKVTFKPSSQPNAVTFGDIRVQDQNISLHAGACGPHGQLCALHSQEMPSAETSHQILREDRCPEEQGWTSTKDSTVKKISLSYSCDPEAEEEPMTSLTHKWPPKLEPSSRLKSPESSCGENIPTVLKTDSREYDWSISSNSELLAPRNKRTPPAVSSPEGSRVHVGPPHAVNLDNQGAANGKPNPGSGFRRAGKRSLSSPRRRQREPAASHSCLDLTTRGRPHSCLSQSSDEHSLGTLCDSGRAPSPADSLDSSYTFVVGPSRDYGVNRSSLSYNGRLSKSAVDLTHRTRPLISAGPNERVGAWTVNCSNFSSSSPPPSGELGVFDRGQAVSYQVPTSDSTQPLVGRSLSLSVLDVSLHEPKRGRGLALAGVQEEGESSWFTPREGLPIHQFGKQGSGRADLTLPSGIYCTPHGQLFIVDCGNARVQVTDPRGNVLQQITSPNSEGLARRCRNFFDIAVNSKGLIALSCAAERSLLVFNRHGRLLQTFGGSGLGSAKDELEAPRGVTVTQLDEFLVADIRKGTLIALKLDYKTGSRLERTIVTGFHRPYLVAACVSSGMVAVSERGTETGRVPCIKVLEPGWSTVRVLGVCSAMGPVLHCPWGVCIDSKGSVLVADWGETHRVLVYPTYGAGWTLVTQGLSSPRGITLLPEGHLAVCDSMNHCVKVYQYMANQH